MSLKYVWNNVAVTISLDIIWSLWTRRTFSEMECLSEEKG